MATTDRPSVDIEPEHRIAANFAAAYGLAPPIPIDTIIAEFADVETASFPGTWDALILRKKSNARPRLILSSSLSKNRVRFTLAHELGHIVIPWSIGTMFCHASMSYHVSDTLLQSIESEANRFAAELLFPAAWVKKKLEGCGSISAEFLIDTAHEAAVSPIVAMLGTCRACPPGMLWIIANDDGSIDYKATSPESLCNPPDHWSKSVHDEMVRAGAKLSSVRYSGKTLYAVDFSGAAPPAPKTALVGTPQEVLKAILRDCIPDTEQQKRAMQSISGIIGYANTMAKDTSHAGILSALRQRFFGRPELAAVTSHPQFNAYIEAKAQELSGRR